MGQKESYVKNGLVLWLDGIKKGNTSGVWTDQISGHVFTPYNNSVVFGTDYVALDGTMNCYLQNTTFVTPLASTGTIEIVISDYSATKKQLVYMPGVSGGLAFGILNPNHFLWTATPPSRRKFPLQDTSRTISVFGHGINVTANVTAIANGVSLSSDGVDGWSGVLSGTNFIGRRNPGNSFDGKIYAIRIYNRQLTESEIIKNQCLDNKRFNLGLTI